jgi:endo-1,4-beta-D-glucanase Y
MSEDTKTGLERHLQTILSAVALAIMLWVGSSITQTRESLARLDERVAGVQERLARLEQLERRVDIIERDRRNSQ